MSQPPSQNSLAVIAGMAQIATGAELDHWAEHAGVPPRMRQDNAVHPETDDSLRRRILSEMRKQLAPNPQMEVYALGALHTLAQEALDEWQHDNEVTTLSPELLHGLKILIVEAMQKAREL
jgi:hypothetical protein